MVRMQVLGLGLVIVLSWAGWTSSSTVDPRKTVGHWYHIYTASNELEELRVEDFMRLHSPYFDCSGHNCDAISLEFVYRYLGYCRYVYMVLRKQHMGLYNFTVPPWNILEVLDVGNSMMLLGYRYHSSIGNSYAVLALGREHTLSEADMEKFQKVLQQKGIMKEPVRFTGDDFCRHN